MRMNGRRDIPKPIDEYLTIMAAGVLLAEVASPHIPIVGLAALYIVGGVIWAALRHVLPRPGDDADPSGHGSAT